MAFLLWIPSHSLLFNEVVSSQSHSSSTTVFKTRDVDTAARAIRSSASELKSASASELKSKSTRIRAPRALGSSEPSLSFVVDSAHGGA